MFKSAILDDISRVILAASIPIILVIAAVRVVMTPLFLQLEYNRPGFPADPYGFTQEQRLEYAPITVEYLLNTEDISFLGNQTLPAELVWPTNCIPVPDAPDRCFMFNERELRHMHDVKVVTVYTFRLGIIGALLAALSVLQLARFNRTLLRSALLSGGLLTLGIIATIILMALTAWEFFFTGFHRIFFEGDSWLFSYSDTLIRLFPEQFWFDAAVLIGSLSIIGALLLVLLWWKWNMVFATKPKETQS